jgi:hypothetical protein
MKSTRGLSAAIVICLACVGCASGARKKSPPPSPSSPTLRTETVVIRFGTGPGAVTRPAPKISSLPRLPGVRDCHFWVSGLISQGGRTYEVDLAVLAEQANSTVTQLKARYPDISAGLVGPSLKPETSLPPSPTAETRPNDAGPITCADTASYGA